MADCELKRPGNVLPAQGAQLTAPQPGGNRHCVIGFVQNRFVHNDFQQSLHFVLLRNMLFLFLRKFLADTVRRVERNNVIFLVVLQHRGNGFKILLYSTFLDLVSVSARTLAQLLAHFLQHQRADFGKRNAADDWIDNFQIAAIPSQRSGFEIWFLPVQPCLGVAVKVSLVTFLNAVFEFFLNALGLSHNILLNPTLGNFRRYCYRLCFHPFLPVDLIAIADGDFEFSFGFFLDVSHYTSLLVNQISVIADFHRHFSFSLFQKQRHSWQFSNSSCLRLYFCRTSHFPRGYAPYFLRQDLSDDANDACDAIFEISQPDN